MSVEKDWTTEAGYRAVAIRHPSLGHLCGYVGIPGDHPLHGLHYDHGDTDGIDVHGGLTYADGRAPRIEPDGTWWFGFDCAHLGDLVPGISTLPREINEVERTLDYVIEHCESLARQLAEHTAHGRAR